MSPATCYHGNRTAQGVVIIAHDKVTHDRRALPHIIRHSPTGMEWGYGGSGPADLARSILIDALGPAALCPACLGSKRLAWEPEADAEVPFDPARHHEDQALGCLCDDGYRPLPYQAFKWEFVARWQQDGWRIERKQVLAWLIDQGCDVPSWVSAVPARSDWAQQLAADVAQVHDIETRGQP